MARKEDSTVKAEVIERPQVKEIEDPKAVTHATAAIWDSTSPANKYNPWRDAPYTKAKAGALDERGFKKVVEECRYFYRRDPIANTTIDKLIEIGINNLIIDKGSLSENQYRILEGIKPQVLDFLKDGALEFLISGLVIPSVTFEWKKKSYLEDMGVKKYSKAWLPKDLWFRNPNNIELKESFVSKEPMYFLDIPTDYLRLLKKAIDGKGVQDTKEISDFMTSYPGFVEQIKSGSKKIRLANKNRLFIRRNPMVDSPYPTPYLYPALESLQHKRNIRAMDFSLSSRVIEAIQVFRLGDKDFPLTQETEYQLEDLKTQITNRYAISPASIERVFQLFGNHTLQIEWVIPPIEALLNAEKYKEINNDIIYALGFPRVLIMGESERTGSSDHDFATLSPIATMESFRERLLRIAKYVFDEVVKKNDLGDYGGVRFEKINLVKFQELSDALLQLYEKGNVSRTSVSDFYGYNWEEEVQLRKEEKDLLEELGLDEYNPQPFDKPVTEEPSSNNDTKMDEKPTENEPKSPKKE